MLFCVFKVCVLLTAVLAACSSTIWLDNNTQCCSNVCLTRINERSFCVACWNLFWNAVASGSVLEEENQHGSFIIKSDRFLSEKEFEGVIFSRALWHDALLCAEDLVCWSLFSCKIIYVVLFSFLLCIPVQLSLCSLSAGFICVSIFSDSLPSFPSFIWM